MFDTVIAPSDWQPIPEAVLEELGPLPAPDSQRSDADTVALTIGWTDPVAAVAGPVGTFAAVPMTQLSEIAVEDALSCLDRVQRRVEAQRLAAVAAVASHGSDHNAFGKDFSANAISALLSVSLPAADRLIGTARQVTTVLTATLQALADGRVSLRQLEAMVELTAGLHDDLAKAVEARVLERAAGKDYTAFRAATRRAVAALHPEWSAHAERARATDTRVVHTAFDDGMGELHVTAPLEVTALVHTALSAYAAATRQLAGGTIAERMAAGLRDWAEQYLTAPGAPTRHRRPYTVNVCIDLPTLLGLADHPAELVGYGPIPALAARYLTADGASLRRLVTDPTTGRLIDYGRTTYTAPPDLADWLIALNQTSMAPNSHTPAAHCDMEHRQSWDTGGRTSSLNMTPLNRRWHNPKTHGGWTYTIDDHDIVTWRSPTGLTYRVEPHDYRLGP